MTLVYRFGQKTKLLRYSNLCTRRWRSNEVRDQWLAECLDLQAAFNQLFEDATNLNDALRQLAARYRARYHTSPPTRSKTDDEWQQTEGALLNGVDLYRAA